MKIDRHNYEEYFLLYVDNELSVEQKNEVELFVKQNPDLEEELIMLQQSRLIPDDNVVFHDKHLLIKETSNATIGLDNYEEWLTLYVDNELRQEDKARVEKFIAEHPHIRQQLSLFQQTKLVPEEIVFTNKRVLYRTEKARLISIQWWRVAAAAILIVAAGITTYSVLHTSKHATPDLATAKKQEPGKQTTRNTTTQKNATAPVDHEKAIVITTTSVNKPQLKEKSARRTEKSPTAVQSQQLVVDIPRQKAVIIDNSDIIGNKEPGMRTAIAARDPHKQIINDTTVTNNLRQTPEPVYASNTDNSENKRLRGFFRKATRLIEHTTKISPADDDNRVLIGGMAINLK